MSEELNSREKIRKYQEAINSMLLILTDLNNRRDGGIKGRLSAALEGDKDSLQAFVDKIVKDLETVQANLTEIEEKEPHDRALARDEELQNKIFIEIDNLLMSAANKLIKVYDQLEQSNADLQNANTENGELKKQLEKLEAENAELKEKLLKQKR